MHTAWLNGIALLLVLPERRPALPLCCCDPRNAFGAHRALLSRPVHRGRILASQQAPGLFQACNFLIDLYYQCFGVHSWILQGSVLVETSKPR
jgi:hypothetical protein